MKNTIFAKPSGAQTKNDLALFQKGSHCRRQSGASKWGLHIEQPSSGERCPVLPTMRSSARPADHPWGSPVLPTIHPIQSPSDRQTVQSCRDARQVLCWLLRYSLYSQPLQRWRPGISKKHASYCGAFSTKWKSKVILLHKVKHTRIDIDFR